MEEQELTKRERKALKKQEQEEHRVRLAAEHRTQTRNRWTIILISVVVIVGFLAWLIQNRPPQQYGTDSTPGEVNPVTAIDHVYGATGDAVKATLIEFGDYQCPACGAYYPAVKQITEDHKDTLQFVFRNLPLSQLHPNAQLAAKYAEAAGAQGKYFEMHDALYEKQKDWSDLNSSAAESAFIQYGKDLGLDTDKLTQDANATSTTQKIEDERIDAIGAGAQGTPTFVLNGKIIENPQTLDDFTKLIDDAVGGTAVASSSATLPTPSAEVQ